MKIKSLAMMSLVVLVSHLSGCQDKQAQLEAESNAALESMLQPTNNKLLSDEEIKANLRKNSNGSATSK